MPPKYVFNHVVMYDPSQDIWRVYRKLDKKIMKTVECYGSKSIANGMTPDEAIESAMKQGVKRWDVQILKP